jgi:hypothetical protein
MNKGLKIAIGIATIGVIGTATYFIIKKIKENRDAKDGNENPTIDPPANVVGNENSNVKTPFKNKAQSDLFRQFVNRFYPSYAQEIDLDLTGDSDNSFMRKAWGKYGETYKKFNPSFEKASGSSIPKVLLDAYALRKDKGSFSNNSEGAIFLQTKELGKIDNEKVVAYFYGSGKVSFTKGGKRIRYDKWWNNGKSINAGINYSGNDYFNTAFKVFEALKQGDDTLEQLNLQSNLRTFPFNGNGNLQGDLDAPSRKGIGLDLNIID